MQDFIDILEEWKNTIPRNADREYSFNGEEQKTVIIVLTYSLKGKEQKIEKKFSFFSKDFNYPNLDMHKGDSYNLRQLLIEMEQEYSKFLEGTDNLIDQ